MLRVKGRNKKSRSLFLQDVACVSSVVNTDVDDGHTPTGNYSKDMTHKVILLTSLYKTLNLSILHVNKGNKMITVYQ